MKSVLTAAVAMSVLLSPAAFAQSTDSTLKPLDPAAVSLLTGGPAPAPSPTYQAAPARAPMSTMLPSGSRLSTALERFVRERGWDLRWQIEEDYMLDANLPIPSGDVIEAVTWVVNTYQSQGGMPGVVPRFARSNQIVVVEKMDVRGSL